MPEDKKYEVRDEKGKSLGKILILDKEIKINSDDPSLTVYPLGLVSENNNLRFELIDSKYRHLIYEVKK